MVKTILILAFVVMMGFILVNRQRVFIRDPVATVYRNEVKQSGIQVFINYSNDVLLEKEEEPGAYRTILQNWDETPGIPSDLVCIRWMACLTRADHAPANPIVRTGKGKYDPKVTMTSREISFVDGDGTRVRVELH